MGDTLCCCALLARSGYAVAHESSVSSLFTALVLNRAQSDKLTNASFAL